MLTPTMHLIELIKEELLSLVKTFLHSSRPPLPNVYISKLNVYLSGSLPKLMKLKPSASSLVAFSLRSNLVCASVRQIRDSRCVIVMGELLNHWFCFWSSR